MSATVLLIDDEESIRKLLSRIITLEGFEVSQASSIAAARKILQQKDPDLILCDVKLPDGNGIDFASEIKKNHPFTETILLTAYGTIPDSVQAIKNGAFDYITKGDDNNRIIPLLHRALEKSNLQKKLARLEKQIGRKYQFESIIGNSPSIRKAIELARKVSATDTTVLLLGETGTGKEVFAQSIHNNSPRKNQPFIAINCSAFSKELLESELFGHKAGAFTNAIKDKKGLIEEAHRGTLFLDEIGEMQYELQSKLLRVLETGEFIKVGDNSVTTTDVRIIAATNRDLQQQVEKQLFREDLLYRLNVFTIHLPALRERTEDIPALVDFYVQEFSAKTNQRPRKTDPGLLKKLKQLPWKGNIRELKNFVERMVLLSESDLLSADIVPPASTTDFSFELAQMEKNHILKVLAHTQGNKTEASRLLGIGLTTLYRKLEEYKISH